MSKAKFKNRHKSRGRGRAPHAKPGDIISLVEKIHHEEDKMDIHCVNNLANYYQILREQAEGKGKFKDIGIKDQTKAVEYCISRAEALISEYYEYSEDGSSEEIDNEEDTSTALLISLAANQE